MRRREAGGGEASLSLPPEPGGVWRGLCQECCLLKWRTTALYFHQQTVNFSPAFPNWLPRALGLLLADWGAQDTQSWAKG